MKIHTRDRPGVETVFVISTIFGLFSCCIAALPFSVKPDEVATVIGKAFTYKLSAEMSTHPGYTFKFHAPDSQNLPSWLYYDDTRHLLLGVPSYHDKGSNTIQLDVINDEANKTADIFNFLTIEIVEYEEDLNHLNVLRTNTSPQPGKNTSQSSLNCPNHAPVIVATLVFDLNSRKLSGSDRVKLLKTVSKWTDIDVDQHRWMPGKGEKTAFNLKDVVVLTAGPGWVRDAQERGVSVSWKIGCGDSITENERSYISVSNLKSASQTGAFKKELSSPVVAWHVTYGRVKHRQVVRVRRQALAQTPVPTSTIITPTASVITKSIVSYAAGTPIVSRSPTAFSVTPTVTRIIPSPTRTAIPSATPVVPSVIISTIEPKNEAPSIANRIPNITAVINEPFRFSIPSNTFHDREDGSTRKLKLAVYDIKGNPLPIGLWVQFDKKDQTLNGTPKQLGETTIWLIVTDNEGSKSDLLPVTITVVRTNKPPYLYNHIDVIRLYINQPLVFKVPYDTFHDEEDGATRNLGLTLMAVGDVTYSWVEFDANSQTIYALPRGEIIGKHEFHLIATDRGGKKSYDAFEFHVKKALVKEPNALFGLKLDAEYDEFQKSAANRVKLCVQIGDYFGDYFNTSYKDIRVRGFKKGSVILEWNFANIATNLTAVRIYKDQFIVPGSEDTPAPELKELMKSSCPVSTSCSVTSAYVKIVQPISTTPDPNVVGRTGDEDDGTWWEYTIIPAFVIAALIFIIGLIIIICIRCRRNSKLDKNEKVVFVQRKKPAVFREEYPMREVYGNQPLITPNEKAPLPPPAYPRSSTPTEDPSERLLHDSSPSYQAPFDSGHEPAGNSRPPVASYRLPPPYVAP